MTTQNIIAQTEHDQDTAPELGPEFFVRAERGKYYKQYQKTQQEAADTVRLAPDVRAAFPTDEAVNEALRRLMQQDEAAAQKPPAVAER